MGIIRDMYGGGHDNALRTKFGSLSESRARACPKTIDAYLRTEEFWDPIWVPVRRNLSEVSTYVAYFVFHRAKSSPKRVPSSFCFTQSLIKHVLVDETMFGTPPSYHSHIIKCLCTTSTRLTPLSCQRSLSKPPGMKAAVSPSYSARTSSAA